MRKTRLFAVMALLGLIVIVFGACSEPTPSPTPPTETAIQNAVEARNAALAYLQTASGDIPGSNANWQETDITTPGLIGGVQKQYTTDEWTIGIAYNVVRPDQVTYHVVISSVKHGLHWEGKVKADGTVNEISPLIEMSEGESKKAAENFVRNSPTFTFDGMADTLKLVDTLRARCPYCWVFVFEFDSAHGGYGDRSGQVVAEVITHHRASVAVEQMEIASAVIDDEWDMLLQKELKTFPPSTEGKVLAEVSCDDFMANNHIAKQVDVNAGDTFTVILCSNPSTGFQWVEEAQISDPTTVKQAGHNFISPESDPPPPPGTPGQEIWTFEALREGIATVFMEYSRPWEGGEKGEWTFELTVSVK